MVITQNRDLWRNLYRSLPYFVVRVRCGKESSRSLSHLLMSFLFKLTATAILDLMWVMLDHPRNAIVGLSLVLKFGLDPIYREEL